MTVCNLCGSSEFTDFKGRPKVMCVGCGSVERTRALKLILDSKGLVRPGTRVMHLAPETGVGRYLKSTVGAGYECYDIDPARYAPDLGVRRMDLVTDVEGLPSEAYDLILHSHVIEHLLCNETAVLFHLHRALKKSGTHVFCIPIHQGHYESDLRHLSPAERERRFFQNDHVRRFGREDIQRTVGMIFNLAVTDLGALATPDELHDLCIPEFAWRGISSHNFFVLGKDDLKLKL